MTAHPTTRPHGENDKCAITAKTASQKKEQQWEHGTSTPT